MVMPVLSNSIRIMRFAAFALVALTACTAASPSLYDGSSPQLAMDAQGTIRMVFGRGDTVFAATSGDQGTTFAAPVVVGVVPAMHLGNTRGPVIASSRSRTLIAAGDRTGNTTLFELDHASNQWTRKSWMLNTATGSSPEGLGSLAADSADTFFAVWLDFRESMQTHLYLARLQSGATSAPVNTRIYASPDGHVCECCRPMMAVNGGSITVLFRNWVAGNRDMYVITSTDRGQTFAPATKLGTSSWKLDACPMDGGALGLDDAGRPLSVWRREESVYYTGPNGGEQLIGNGKNPMMSVRGTTTYLVWDSGGQIRLRILPSTSDVDVGRGRLPQVLATNDGAALVAWESDGKIYTRRVK